MQNELKKEFIAFMLDAGVLRFGEFVTKSGRHSPYFVNTGLYKTGAQVAALGKYYAALVQTKIGSDFSAIFGPAYKGIPLAVMTAASLMTQHGIDKPYFFNRKEEKDHGEGGLFIGYTPVDGDRIILIEDVLTAGTQLRLALPLLQSCAKVTVEHMFISVDRCEKAADSETTAVLQAKDELGITVHSIVNVLDIYSYLQENSADAQTLARMDTYMQQYCVL